VEFSGENKLLYRRMIYCFRWDLPPNLGYIPKQPDSLNAHYPQRAARKTRFLR
jgi:hypothetical protein